MNAASARKLFQGPLGFCVLGGALLLGLGLLSLTDTFETFVHAPAREFNAWLNHVTLNTIGVETRLEGVFVYGVGPAPFNIEVIDECTGISVLIILASLTLAFPSPWRSRLIGLGLGALVIAFLNWVRLVSLYLVGKYYPELFHDLHVYVWQGVFILAVFSYWYAWAYRAGKRKGLAAAEAEPEVSA
ncbi:MAG: archaeosortase/exosortase family protein [Planctomycetota bacterium]